MRYYTSQRATKVTMPATLVVQHVLLPSANQENEPISQDNDAHVWQQSANQSEALTPPVPHPEAAVRGRRRRESVKIRGEEAPRVLAAELPKVWADEPMPSSQPISIQQSSSLGCEQRSLPNLLPPSFHRTAKSASKMGSNEQSKLVLWLSNCQGNLSMINQYVEYNQAKAVVHVGNFGFFDADTCRRARLEDLRNLVQDWPELDNSRRQYLLGLGEEQLRQAASDLVATSELSSFISGEQRFTVPVYVVPGRFEDVAVIERVKRGDYHIPNLYLIDQRISYTVHLGGQRVRLLGLGGAMEYERLFTVGPAGSEQTAGSHVECWPTLMQLGELLTMADALPRDELRILVCSQPLGREALWSMVARAVGAQYTVSCSLKPGARMACWSDASIHTLESYTLQTTSCKSTLAALWRAVWEATGDRFSEAHLRLIERALRLLSDSALFDEQALEVPWNVQLNFEAQAVMNAGDNYLDWECQVRDPLRRPTATQAAFNLNAILASRSSHSGPLPSSTSAFHVNAASSPSPHTSTSNYRSNPPPTPTQINPLYGEVYPPDLTGFLTDEHSVLIFGLPPHNPVPVSELVQECLADFKVRAAKYIMIGHTPRPLVDLGSEAEQARALQELSLRPFRGFNLRVEKKNPKRDSRH